MNCVVAKKVKHAAKQMHIAKEHIVLDDKPKNITSEHLSGARHKPVSPFYYPKPDEMRGKVKIEPPKIPPHGDLMNLSHPREMKTIGNKKAPAYIVMAVGSAFVISSALAFFFCCVMNIDNVFSLMLALLCFIGLSVIFYSFSELSERTGTS